MNLISFTVSYIYTILQEIYIQLSLDLKFNVMLNKLKKISALRAQLKQCSTKKSRSAPTKYNVKQFRGGPAN